MPRHQPSWRTDLQGNALSHLRRFGADENGATMLEYALIVAFLVILTVSSVAYFGKSLNNSYARIGNSFN